MSYSEKMSTPETLPRNTATFVAATAFEATCRTERGVEHLLVESRMTADRQTTVFTKVGGRPIRAGSIYELIAQVPGCLSIANHHRVPVLWNGVQRKAELIEEFVTTADTSQLIQVVLRLTLDGVTYETEPCITLTDALLELGDVIGSHVTWRLQTCYHCLYSFAAYPGPSSDRDELRCYRDAPEAFEEIYHHGKFASQEALHAGAYAMNAFHTCVAWEPLTTRSPMSEGA